MRYKEYTVKVHPNGNKFWFHSGVLHREDGPAIEYADGVKCWYLNNKRHREDGPAVEFADGGKEWYLNGKRHREDGPAIECVRGDKYWFLNDTELTEQEFLSRKQGNSCDGKIVEIDGVKYKLKAL